MMNPLVCIFFLLAINNFIDEYWLKFEAEFVYASYG